MTMLAGSSKLILLRKSVNRPSWLSKCIRYKSNIINDPMLVDFNSITKEMIRKNYEILDSVKKKNYGKRRNVLAFELKQMSQLERHMQPRNYAPLKRPMKLLFHKNKF